MKVTSENAHEIADNLGCGIDAGIRDIVVRFNALNLETDASCEGHTDRALPYPWLDFPSPGRFIKQCLGDFYRFDAAPRLKFEHYPMGDRLRPIDGLSIEEGRQEMERFATWLEGRAKWPIHVAGTEGTRCGLPPSSSYFVVTEASDPLVTCEKCRT
jgi:hypothetical protein